MGYTPVTPFRRTVDAAILKHQAAAQRDLPANGANKWEVLRELATARAAFGLSDRDLTVLQALVSFHPATILGANRADLIVFPSNKAICERLNGMPCSTMRRHLGNLVRTGFIVRRDSPNGKRYCRTQGDDRLAFGFDLAPLVLRFHDICAAAETQRAEVERHTRLRTLVSVMRRDLASLAEFGQSVRPDLTIWDQFSDLARLTARDLRRKLDVPSLAAIETRLQEALEAARRLVGPAETPNMSTTDSVTEQHHQNSKINLQDSEPGLEKAQGVRAAHPHERTGQTGPSVDRDDPPPETEDEAQLPNIPLGLVLAACREFQTYSDTPVRHWHDLVRVADILRPMMGISPSLWDDAKHHMGPEQAAVVAVALLERFGEIRSPGGYLRTLTTKAAQGAFSCGPMIMALMHKEAA